MFSCAEEEVTLESLVCMSESTLCQLIPKAGPLSLLKFKLNKVSDH